MFGRVKRFMWPFRQDPISPRGGDETTADANDLAVDERQRRLLQYVNIIALSARNLTHLSYPQPPSSHARLPKHMQNDFVFGKRRKAAFKELSPREISHSKFADHHAKATNGVHRALVAHAIRMEGCKFGTNAPARCENCRKKGTAYRVYKNCVKGAIKDPGSACGRCKVLRLKCSL